VKRVTHRKVFCAFTRHGHNVSLCGGRGLLLREYYRGRYDLVRAKLVPARPQRGSRRPSDPLLASSAAVEGLGIRPISGARLDRSGTPIGSGTSAPAAGRPQAQAPTISTYGRWGERRLGSLATRSGRTSIPPLPPMYRARPSKNPAPAWVAIECLRMEPLDDFRIYFRREGFVKARRR